MNKFEVFLDEVKNEVLECVDEGDPVPEGFEDGVNALFSHMLLRMREEGYLPPEDPLGKIVL